MNCRYPVSCNARGFCDCSHLEQEDKMTLATCTECGQNFDKEVRHVCKRETNLVELPRLKGDKDQADLLRKYADDVGSGGLVNFVFVARYGTENRIDRFGSWKDRWEILGALEYAKSTISAG